MIRLFGVPDSMGERALEWLDSQLLRKWTDSDLPELETLLKRVARASTGPNCTKS